MENLLFSSRSIWTMIHGVGLGGGALIALAAGLFGLGTLGPANGQPVPEKHARYLSWALVCAAILLWLTVVLGTYVNFPAYRATPPEGLTELGRYPRSLIQSNPGTVWLHSFAMEIKEHVPWIAAMLSTSVAFVASRHGVRLLSDQRLRSIALALLAICFSLVAGASLLGVFINKVAPLE